MCRCSWIGFFFTALTQQTPLTTPLTCKEWRSGSWPVVLNDPCVKIWLDSAHRCFNPVCLRLTPTVWLWQGSMRSLCRINSPVLQKETLRKVAELPSTRQQFSFSSAVRQGHSIKPLLGHCAASVSWPVFLNLSYALFLPIFPSASPSLVPSFPPSLPHQPQLSPPPPPPPVDLSGV